MLNIINPTANHMVVDEQHGFRLERSTTSSHNFKTYLLEAFLISSQVYVIYKDFSKAFDNENGFGDPLFS